MFLGVVNREQKNTQKKDGRKQIKGRKKWSDRQG